MSDGVPIIQNMAIVIQNVHIQTSIYYIAEVFATVFRLGVVKQVAKIKCYEKDSNFCHVFVHFDHWFPTTETVLFQLALSRALYLDYEIDPRSPWRISRIPNIYEGMQIEANMDEDWTDIKSGRIIKIFFNGDVIIELNTDASAPYYRIESTNLRTMERMPLHIYTPSSYSKDGKRNEHKYALRFSYDPEKSSVINSREINDDMPDLFWTFAERGSKQALDDLLNNYEGYSLYFEKKDYEIKKMYGWDYNDWQLLSEKTKRTNRPSLEKKDIEEYKNDLVESKL